MKLTIFVVGISAELRRAMQSVLAEGSAAKQLEIVDVLQNGELALSHGVFVTPAILVEMGGETHQLLTSTQRLPQLLARIARRMRELPDSALTLDELRALLVVPHEQAPTPTGARASSSPAGMLLLDRTGIVLQSDPVARDWLGLSDAQGIVLGMPASRTDEALRICTIGRDGTPRWLMLRCMTVPDSGQTIMVVLPDSSDHASQPRPDQQETDGSPQPAPNAGVLDWSNNEHLLDQLIQDSRDRDVDISVVVLPNFATDFRVFGIKYMHALEGSFLRSLVAAYPSSASIFQMSTGVYVIVSADQVSAEMGEHRVRQMRLFLGGEVTGETELSLVVEPEVQHFSASGLPQHDVMGSIEDLAEHMLAKLRPPTAGVHAAEADTDHRREIARALIEADLRHEFRVVIQPVVRLSDSVTTGGEMLLRWTSPSIGEVPPSLFIPLAEQLGLIDRLTFFVLDEAIRVLRESRRENRCCTLAINLAPGSLTDAGFRTAVLDRLRANADVCPRLAMEITERSQLPMSDDLRAFVRDLDALNVALLIDDFGSGSASLALLKEFRINTLKLTGELAEGLRGSTEDERLVNWLGQVVRLAHGMGARVLAEGIETEDELLTVQRLGVDDVQGYYFARPLPVVDFTARLRGG